MAPIREDHLEPRHMLAKSIKSRYGVGAYWMSLGGKSASPAPWLGRSPKAGGFFTGEMRDGALPFPPPAPNLAALNGWGDYAGGPIKDGIRRHSP